MNFFARLLKWWRAADEPFDIDFQDSDLGGDFADRIPGDIDCPETEPTRPGLLELERPSP